MSFIVVDRVTLAPGRDAVLRDISLRIEAGEFIGVLGPNGAGKTTLLRALLGVLAPRAGGITIGGQIARPGNGDIGYMPQTRSIPPGLKLSGRAFVAAAARSGWGLAWGDRASRMAVAAALDLVDAAALADEPLNTLSGGQRQRLLLAQALLGTPRLLLLDEPLISLDPTRQKTVIDLITRVQRDTGATVLFTAHELNPLLGALDRVLYLGNGSAALGTVDEVITAPVLSKLYGAEIEVVRAGGHVFVMAGGADLERGAHDHEHDDGHDHHGHG